MYLDIVTVDVFFSKYVQTNYLCEPESLKQLKNQINTRLSRFFSNPLCSINV